MKFIWYWIIGLFVYLFIPHGVYASGEFQADYNVQYAISPTGTTIVTQNITLTNNQTNLYPQKYSIVLDTTKIKNVIAYDSNQIVPIDITQSDGKTQITVTFNDKVVGLGRKLSFTLRFENGDITEKNGNIWEVNIPGITADADIASYTVTVSVPASFGPNAYMSPLPVDGVHWTKSQMVNGGISAAYGSAQVFDVHLSYYLDNPSIRTQTREIALPPDTAYQTVVVESLEPPAQTVTRDTDGNWLAQYTLLPQQNVSINTTLRIAITLYPKQGYTDPKPDLSVYTAKDTYWESDSARIVALAKDYRTPRDIYQYVVSTLRYDYSRIQETPIRKGAQSALDAPDNSVCMEFTDVFVAIARAAGIPARQAVGYAYTTNNRLRPLSLVTDVLHAWPEYYDSDKGVWTPVDPTWANTTGGTNYFDKLDFNHIVFALQGTSSTSPYPAGFYRKNGKTTKDVSVSFRPGPFVLPHEKLTTVIDFPNRVTAGLTSRGSLSVKNVSGAAQGPTRVIVQSFPVDLAMIKTIDYIPPYGIVSYPLNLTLPSLFSKGSGKITINVNGNTKQQRFDIQPITSYFIIPILSFGAMLIILSLLGIRHLWKRRTKH